MNIRPFFIFCFIFPYKQMFKKQKSREERLLPVQNEEHEGNSYESIVPLGISSGAAPLPFVHDIVKQLKAMFPEHPNTVLDEILQENDYNIEKAANSILVQQQIELDRKLAQQFQNS